MAGHSLLRRLQNPALLAPRRHVSEAEVRESILEHLRLMCTTRAGTMLTCPDYGIADVSDLVHDFPDAIALLARSIRNTIQTYEPRLTNVVVKHVPSEDRELVVRYEIVAHIQQQGGKTPIKFETKVGSSGNVTIE
jgi:type VI secretion system protein